MVQKAPGTTFLVAGTKMNKVPDGKGHYTFEGLWICSRRRRKYVRLEGKKYAEERGGLCSQSLEKPQGLGFCFISDGEPWKALEQESVLFRLYY